MTELQVDFKTDEGVLADLGQVRLVHFTILSPGGITTPAAFAEAAEASADLFAPVGKGVIISGKGPIWGHAMLLHAAHAARWVAVFDPRLPGAVICQSHVPGVRVGSVISCEDLGAAALLPGT